MIQKLKNKIFKRKLSKLGFDMNDEENINIAEALNNKGLGGNHFVKCMENGLKTKRLQDVCELLSGRKEAGRYLQLKPIVIQCHFCQKDFATKEGVVFVDKCINLKSLENIVKHLISCDGIICDCGKKVHYFEVCKCKRKWDERSIHLMNIRKEVLTKEQKEQIKKYKQIKEEKEQ